MNILILNPILYTADYNTIPKVESIKDTMIYNMALGFVNNGCDVTLIAAKEYQPVKEESYDFTVIFLRSAFQRVMNPTVLPFNPDLFGFLRTNKEKFDIILSSELFSIPSLMAAIVAPSKTIIWHEMTLHQRKFHRLPSLFWYNCVARTLMRRPLVVPRSNTAYAFVSQYHKNTTTEIVEHGINTQTHTYSAEKDKSFVIVSRLDDRKNITPMITKFAELINRTQYKDFILYIIGRGPDENIIRKHIAKLNLEENVVLTGFLRHPDMNRYVRRAMSLLIDTTRDQNMVSIPEAIVSGTPVLTNSFPNSSAYIKNFTLGIVKDDWGIDEMVEIIENNTKYVSNCIKYRSNLTNTAGAKHIIEIYKRVNNADKIYK